MKSFSLKLLVLVLPLFLYACNTKDSTTLNSDTSSDTSGSTNDNNTTSDDSSSSTDTSSNSDDDSGSDGTSSSTSSTGTSGASDSVPDGAESAKKMLASPTSNTSVASPSRIYFVTMDGVKYVTWKTVENARYYNVYVGWTRNLQEFQILARVDSQDELKYPVNADDSIYITAFSSDGVESEASSLASEFIAKTSRKEDSAPD